MAIAGRYGIMSIRKLYLSVLGLALLAVCTSCTGNSASGTPDPSTGNSKELLNVSYDPTRELWSQINEAFIAQHKKETGETVAIKPSHGGSSSQAQAVIQGLAADVVTLALWSDTELLHKNGLIADGWEERLPNRS